jgi:hypothetical protein
MRWSDLVPYPYFSVPALPTEERVPASSPTVVIIGAGRLLRATLPALSLLRRVQNQRRQDVDAWR